MEIVPAFTRTEANSGDKIEVMTFVQIDVETRGG